MLKRNGTALFHYTNMECSLKILESGILKPSNVSKLNDIFDWIKEQPVKVDLSTAEKKENFIDVFAKDIYQSRDFVSKYFLKDLPSRQDRQRVKTETRKKRKEISFLEVKENLKIIVQNINYHVIEVPSQKGYYDDRMSFISFTNAHPAHYDKSALMWSHYGGGMKGCAFEFKLLRQPNNYLYQVDYSNIRPNILLPHEALELSKAASYSGEKFEQKYLNAILKLLYCRKHTSYRYEDEIRHLTPDSYPHPLNGDKYLPIKLTKVHVGAHANKNEILKLEEILKAKYPDVSLQCYGCDEHSYNFLALDQKH